MVLACAVIAEAEDAGMPNANPPVQAAGTQTAAKPKKADSLKLRVKPAEAAKIDDAVQKLLKTVKKPAVQSAPIIDAQDFIDTGVMEGSDMLEEGLEIGGMLTDDTVTRFGHDLFDAFNSAWRPPEGASYNITFSERNDASRGSFITVKLNDTLIYEGFLTPRQDAINDLGKGLAKDIRNLVRNTANLESEEYY
jgi:curli production assembly/transport component CsgE